MAKQSGLGDNFAIDGIDLSGDVQSLGPIHGGPAALEMTGINKLAFERQGGVRNGEIAFVSFFNDAPAPAPGAYTALSTRPLTDRIASYFRGTGIGSPMASLAAKQVNYDGARATDGMFTFACQCLANAYGMDWGVQLTAGKRTDAAPTNGASVDGLAASVFGFQAYLHVYAVTGTSVTVKLQESSDNGVGDAWTDVVGGGFTAAVGVTSQRIASTPATLERYLRVVTTGTFSSATFAVQVTRNDTLVSF